MAQAPPQPVPVAPAQPAPQPGAPAIAPPPPAATGLVDPSTLPTLAWLINPHAVLADAPWRDLTQDGALPYLPPASLNQRIDHARMGTVQGLL